MRWIAANDRRAGQMPESHTAARAHIIVHRIRTAQSSYQVLYSFKGKPDGANPSASLIDVKGVLYGTTSGGGKFNKAGGTVFSVSTTGTEHVLHSFPQSQHERVASLIDKGGTLYGTTKYGGPHGGGTIFSITRSGRERLLHSFEIADGRHPEASLVNVRGTLYGTTSVGGSYGYRYDGYGTLFSITTGGAERVLHSFGNGSDGEYPEASLIDVNGTLYGTTYAGGAASRPSCRQGLLAVSCCGTVFSVTKGGAEKILHRFSFGTSDGSLPLASLIDVSGTLYGTTLWGGPNPLEVGGTVFSVSRPARRKYCTASVAAPMANSPARA